VRWDDVAGASTRLVRHKRWMYVGIATDDLYLAVAIVRLGYATNAFTSVYHGPTKRLLARRSWVAPPFAGEVGDTGGEGCHASFRWRGVRIGVDRPAGQTTYALELVAPGLSVETGLDARDAPPAIGAIARVGADRFDATEKRALLSVRGTVRVDGRTLSLDGGLGGYDFTSGLLPRRTRWRWAFALGHSSEGEPIALNLVEGFVGEAECAAWVGTELVPLSEGRFAFDAGRPADRWRVRTADGAADLTMTPGAVHSERRELLVARSRFVQPCGAWSGSIALEGRAPLVIARALGVTEDQDITW
jgi:hypothetical protein